MAAITGTPGVYIEEFEPAPPIQGISTSTAAFLGAAVTGPILDPVPVTSWDGFKQRFGDRPVKGRYLWYAVRGFFANGGRLCYVVRVSNALAAGKELLEATGRVTIVVAARDPGVLGTSVRVRVTPTHAMTATVMKHEVDVLSATGSELTLDTPDNAALFRPGDVVVLTSDTSQRTTLVSVSGRVVRLGRALAVQAGDRLRLAEIARAQGDRTLRLDGLSGEARALAPGTVLRIAQAAAASPTPSPAPTPTPTPGPAAGAQYVTVATVEAQRIVFQSPRQPIVTYRVTMTEPLHNIDLARSAAGALVESQDFTLEVSGPTGAPEVHRYLAMDPSSPNFYRTRVNSGTGGLVLLEPAVPPSPTLPPLDMPVDPADPFLLGGQDEDLSTLLPAHYREGLDALALRKDVNIVAIPDSQDPTVHMQLLDHCQSLGDRFAIVDSRLGAPPLEGDSVAQQRATVVSARGFAAIYYPWLLVEPALSPGVPPPPVPAPNLLVPPSGHVAGIYARTDLERGVHKAPAGETADVRDALGVERIVSDREQDRLNLEHGVDVIRVFRPGGRPVVWGARTTATGINTNWLYVSTRRLFLFLEGSLVQGLRTSVFEPNDRRLWETLKQTISAFLTSVWSDGALFGSTPREAFYVRIDDTLNPPHEMALGRLTIEIGVRPAYPAEFIVVRIGLWHGGAQVNEA